MLSFEYIKNGKSVYFLLTSAFSVNIGHRGEEKLHMPRRASYKRNAP